MIIKLKSGQKLKVDGNEYLIRDIGLRECNREGVSTKASLTLVSYRTGDVINIEFGEWSAAIDEKDLAGLATLLTRG